MDLYNRSRKEIEEGLAALKRIHSAINREEFAEVRDKKFMFYIRDFSDKTGSRPAWNDEPKRYSVKSCSKRVVIPSMNSIRIDSHSEVESDSFEEKDNQLLFHWGKKKIGENVVFSLTEIFEPRIFYSLDSSWGFCDVSDGGGLYRRPKKVDVERYLESRVEEAGREGLYLVSKDFNLGNKNGIRIEYSYKGLKLDDVFFYFNDFPENLKSCLLIEKEKFDKKKSEEEQERQRQESIRSIRSRIYGVNNESLRNAVEYIDRINPSKAKEELSSLLKNRMEDLSLDELNKLGNLLVEK